MKIALIGYGKMGKTIDRLATAVGHEIVLRLDVDNAHEFTAENLQKADVAIEFTRPENAFGNIVKCLDAGVPIVVGTTGWLGRLEEAKQLCEKANGSLFWASNYSIGVNLFFALNRYLAKLMNGQSEYSVKVSETHHTQKLDAPSGTAITLAEGILAELERKSTWINQAGENPEELSILSYREDPAPGTHAIRYDSEVDSLEIIHTAHSRDGFANGAIQAAQWIVGKKGFFGMADLLK